MLLKIRIRNGQRIWKIIFVNVTVTNVAIVSVSRGLTDFHKWMSTYSRVEFDISSFSRI